MKLLTATYRRHVPLQPPIGDTSAVDAMKHVKSIAGIDCIALGSDYDGSATLPFDVTGMPLLVEELMAQGFSENEMRAILGENVKRFMLANLK